VSGVARRLRVTGGRTLELGGGAEPWLMGIVNASPESFSDGAEVGGLETQVALARDLVAAGARVIDVGGESGVTNVAAVGADEEIRRVVPLIARLAGEEGMLVSVDTFTPAVAEAAIAAGAAIVNDVSGLRDPGLADVCARSGAGLVIMHTRAEPKTKVLDHPYADVAADVAEFLRERMDVAAERGVDAEQIVLDPGPDFAKSPAQTVDALGSLGYLHALGRPVLLAVSRKDFVGAITGRGPRERAAGTLAAVAHGLDQGAHILRVHDVAATADFIAVRRTLRGESELPAGLQLAEGLRRAT
jgi:dihydropteroate synthase